MVEDQLRKHGCQVLIGQGWELPAARTLFVVAGMAVPYNLLEAGFGFLAKWDVAAPLWRYGVLAADVGTPSERERTQAITLDLRLLLYAHELLFVRDSADGRRFLETWLAECEGKSEPRLAFLRALHLVKPIICTLPASWVAAEAQRVRLDARVHLPGSKVFAVGKPGPRGVPVLTELRRPVRSAPGLVRFELTPGRFVQCRPGEEEMIRARFSQGRRR
jgi:hypothetical protein